ncbi:MAG: hypothetical protein GTN35_02000 [Nitrososphaeria archaeon]|nr:hypothetical protein [Nitrosopumilaceae archaeon]NIP09294.1 hypothetical protein [Nitrosopumilaceae archaeon]NIP91168.1 hypothetical protein [Nitrososphaeria archaeon]NIS94462.1 hypothetical protein [Nitrosopumilaceae archaeon]
MMSILVNEKKGQSHQWITANTNSADVAVVVYVLEVVTKIGKNFPVLFLSLASLNTILAANDFLANSIEFGILNSLFAASGFIFVIQMHQDKNQFDSKLEEIMK